MFESQKRGSKSSFTVGLNLKITVASAVVLLFFIVITELAISSIIIIDLNNIPSNKQHSLTVNNRLNSNSRLSDVKEVKPVDLSTLATKIRKHIIIYLLTGAFAALFLIALLVNSIAVKPIKKINNGVNDFSNGKYKTRVPINGAKELINLSGSINDMIDTVNSQRTTLETRLEEIKRTSDILKETQEQLIASARLASVGTVASGVAHEIGNPIAGVLGLIDAIEHESDEKAKESFLLLIKKEIYRIDKTISDLLQFSRSSASDKFSTQTSDIESVLNHAKSLVLAQKNFTNITITLKISKPLPPVLIKEDSLTGVIVNLLLNSGEAIDEKGEIEIEAFTDKKEDDSKIIKIIVTDNGRGIPKEYADEIFNPFFSKRKNSKGSGLGLSICQHSIEQSGGTIKLDNTHKKGARFIITLKPE
ncbi:MAG: hypothetical protein JXR91_12525 [Deltaproteobacteria bacterium]|nr:hypothetical protein [Deltaproteobacteria bacterium]